MPAGAEQHVGHRAQRGDHRSLKNFNPGTGALLSETVTVTSANGLSVTAQTDANGALDASGNPIFNATTTDATVIGANGSRKETVTQMAGGGPRRFRRARR